jgi:acetylornithine deacetylase
MSAPLLSETILDQYHDSAVALLKQMIVTPSLSKAEDKTASILGDFLTNQQIPFQRSGNNLWAINKMYDEGKPTILLNSHHDTVKPNEGYSVHPFSSIEKDGKLYGLGSNDAGASLVCLLHTFLHFYNELLPFNLVIAMTAEEEISGEHGVSSILDKIGKIDFGIVGEPTSMRMAVAEKGLMVLDCYAHGKSGHAARNEGENAIYIAITDIEWFKSYQFPKISETLGDVKMSVTMIDSGYQHNVVPDVCHYVVDVRSTDAYSNQEILDIISRKVKSEVKARSTRLNSSGLLADHVLLKVANNMGLETYGSPTLSDQALMGFPTCKIGPGESERSHTADEFVYLEEIKKGIEGYVELLTKINEYAGGNN